MLGKLTNFVWWYLVIIVIGRRLMYMNIKVEHLGVLCFESDCVTKSNIIWGVWNPNVIRVNICICGKCIE